jgi:hypothetical protein
MRSEQSGTESQSCNITKKAIFLVLGLALACTATAAQAQTLSAEDIAPAGGGDYRRFMDTAGSGAEKLMVTFWSVTSSHLISA